MLMQAVYHGVPLISLPCLADQYSIATLVVAKVSQHEHASHSRVCLQHQMPPDIIRRLHGELTRNPSCYQRRALANRWIPPTLRHPPLHLPSGRSWKIPSTARLPELPQGKLRARKRTPVQEAAGVQESICTILFTIQCCSCILHTSALVGNRISSSIPCQLQADACGSPDLATDV